MDIDVNGLRLLDSYDNICIVSSVVGVLVLHHVLTKLLKYDGGHVMYDTTYSNNLGHLSIVYIC